MHGSPRRVWMLMSNVKLDLATEVVGLSMDISTFKVLYSFKICSKGVSTLIHLVTTFRKIMLSFVLSASTSFVNYRCLFGIFEK